MALAPTTSHGGGATGAAGGDLSGTYPNPTVGFINGVAFNNSPQAGYVLTGVDGSNVSYQPLAGAWTTVRKGADESVASSTALQADDVLAFATVAGTVYELQALIIYASPVGAGTPDIKLGFGEDTTARGTLLGSFISTANAASSPTSGLTDQLANWIAGTATTDRAVYLSGAHVAVGGTFTFLWAQNTSGINATIVRAASVLRYRVVS